MAKLNHAETIAKLALNFECWCGTDPCDTGILVSPRRIAGVHELLDHEHIGHVHVQLQQAGAIEQEPPTDPRERALWLLRNRNTGPKERGRWSPRAQARESRRKP